MIVGHHRLTDELFPAGCDLLHPVRTVMSLIIICVHCLMLSMSIVFVASRVFAFLTRTILLLFSLSGSRDICKGVQSMIVCVAL